MNSRGHAIYAFKIKLLVPYLDHALLRRGELDYIVIDIPPGTGDIQLTLCQVAPLTAAVIVTTPPKLAFIDVAKGAHMFSKLKLPCIAVVENMCYYDADRKRHYPFGNGSGSQHLLRVVPVIGILFNKEAFKPVVNTAKVEAVFDAPLEIFLKNENRRSEEREWLGVKYVVHYFDFETGTEKFVIWGLTAAFLIRVASVVYERPPSFLEQERNFVFPKN